jgi:Bacterial Ig domain
MRCLPFLLAAYHASAETIHVAQTAAGLDDGSSAANAKSLAWVNTAGNWGGGAGKVSPGDTVRLCGTFTSQLVVAGSGTAGNMVTLLFEPGANFTTDCWPSSGAIVLNGVSYITIDGGVNGVIRNTNNGTALATQNNSRGIGGGGNGTGILNHGVIKNLTITGMYVNTLAPVPEDRDETRAGYCISVSGTDIVIENNSVSDGDGLITYSATSATQGDIIIRNNTLRRFNHGMTIGVADTNCTLNGMVISGNNFDDSAQYDGPPGGSRHIDGIIIQNNGYSATCRFENLYIHSNCFGGSVGLVTTAAIFNSMQNPRYQCENWYIFNNVFECDSPYSWGNGFINATATNLQIFNNTMIGVIGPPNYGGGITAGGPGCVVKNNILLSGSGITLYNTTYNDETGRTISGADTTYILSTYFADVFSDYNIIGGAPSFQIILIKSQNNQDNWLGGIINGLSNWKTWYNNNRGMTVPIWNTAHADPNSTTIAPTFVGGAAPGKYLPAANDTQARGKGTNLTNVFNTLGIPATDFNGNPRPATGPWTIGAFEAASGTGDITNPAVTITAPVATATHTSTTAALNLAGTATDNVGVTQVTWSNDRGGSGTAGGTTANWTVNGVALLSGQNVLTVTARDAAGNTATDTLTVTYAPAETVNPVIAIATPTANATHTSTTSTLNLAGTATDNVGVTQVIWSNDRGGSGTAGGTGNWTVNGVALQSGQNVLTLTARDAAGNTATDTLTVTYTPPETVNPVIAIATPTANATHTSTSATVDLSGTATDNVGVTQVTWSNDRGGSGTAGGTTNWTINGVALLSGQNVLTLTARDAAGNTGTDTLTVTYTPPTSSNRIPNVPFEAEGGNLTAPFVSDGTSVYQPGGTSLASGGRASYSFTVEEAGDYTFSVLLNAPNDGSNSFFVNVDAEPQDPQMVWDIPVTTGFQQRPVFWRGSGTFDNNEFRPKFFSLGTGQHELIIRGREANVRFNSITIVKRPSKPIIK